MRKAASSMNHLLYAGTYSHPDLFGEDHGPTGRGQGIYALTFDDRSGVLRQARVYEGILNPAYLALSADGRRLFCIHELDTYRGAMGGGVSSYAIQRDGALRQLSSKPTYGGFPCHVAVGPDGGLLSIANYGGGSLCVYSVDEDGALHTPQVFAHRGEGPNRERQEAPHVHSSLFTPSGSHVIAMDLGIDALMAYPVEGETVQQETAYTVAVKPGDGPRMAAYHKAHNLLYVVCELSSQVATLACDAEGAPTHWVGTVSTLPSGNLVPSTAADISLSPDGMFCYASNRGHDSLSVFRVDDQGGLTMVQNIPCGGRTPRAFTLDPTGSWLLCANQDSDTVTVFAVDQVEGTLTPQGELALPSPVCLVFEP